jgi:6-carboxyhexanoate--CoA ligase
MRAAEGGAHEQGGVHISGGERLVPQDQVEQMVGALLQRAMTHEKGRADFVNLTVELVAEEEVRNVCALPITRRLVDTVAAGHEVAIQLLQEAGVNADVAHRAVRLLVDGPAPGGDVMRGAVVMCADTGRRLEADLVRGVRVAKIDWDAQALATWMDIVRAYGIANERVQEAVALATKVVSTAGTVAELCWSDDPSYVAGYVASPVHGFVRIPHLKEMGSPLGGRVFFVRGVESVDDYVAALQAPVLLTEVPNDAILY